jgi:hypothetical protein
MKRKINLIFLSLSLGLCSCIILVNRLIVPLPDWLALMLAGAAVVFLVLSVVNKNPAPKENS